MRKLTIASAAIAATMILAACQPAAKEEEAAAPEANVVAAEPTEAAAAPAADAAADAATATDEAAPAGAEGEAKEGTEHTGGIKVGSGN